MFKFGSVVFFNMHAREREICLKLARKYATAPAAVPCTDSYRILVGRSLSAHSAPVHIIQSVRRCFTGILLVVGQGLGQFLDVQGRALEAGNPSHSIPIHVK